MEQKDDHFALKLPESVRGLSQEILKYCFDKRGGFVSFSLSAPKRPRSTGKGSQSHHFNGHVQQVATETGQPFESVKMFIKHEAITRGYPMLSLKDDEGDYTGVPLLDLYGNTQGISEADATVEEAILLIDEIHQFAAEYSIILVEV